VAIARRLLISGRVQGVGFRWFTHDAASRENVTGWVRNLPDGRVEAYLEGESEAVLRVERALRQGPRGSRIDTVYVDEEQPSGAYRSFSIN
jgi:acylphosphatase